MQAELVNGKGPFEVLSLAPLIASHIDIEPASQVRFKGYKCGL